MTNISKSETTYPSLHKIANKLDQTNLLYYYDHTNKIYVLRDDENYLTILEKPNEKRVKLIIDVAYEQDTYWFDNPIIKFNTIDTQEEAKIASQV